MATEPHIPSEALARLNALRRYVHGAAQVNLLSTVGGLLSSGDFDGDHPQVGQLVNGAMESATSNPLPMLERAFHAYFEEAQNAVQAGVADVTRTLAEYTKDRGYDPAIGEINDLVSRELEFRTLRASAAVETARAMFSLDAHPKVPLLVIVRGHRKMTQEEVARVITYTGIHSRARVLDVKEVTGEIREAPKTLSILRMEVRYEHPSGVLLSPGREFRNVLWHHFAPTVADAVSAILGLPGTYLHVQL